MNIDRKTKYVLKRVFFEIDNRVPIRLFKQIKTLKIGGVPLKMAIYTSFFNNRYIDPRIKEKIKSVDEVLNKTFPNIEFSSSYNGVYIVNRDDNKGLKNNNWGGYANLDSGNAFLPLDDFELSAVHERIHQLLFHGDYSGPQNNYTGEGRALNEGLVEWLDKTYFNGRGISPEFFYIETIKHIFTPEEMLRMSTKGKSTEIWENAFSQFTDIEVLKLLDDNYSSEHSDDENKINLNIITKQLINVYFDYLKWRVRTFLKENKSLEPLESIEQINILVKKSLEGINKSIDYLDSFYKKDMEDKLFDKEIRPHFTNCESIFSEEIQKLCTVILTNQYNIVEDLEIINRENNEGGKKR